MNKSDESSISYLQEEYEHPAEMTIYISLVLGEF